MGDPFFEPDFRCEFGKNGHLFGRFFINFDCTLLAEKTATNQNVINPERDFNQRF